jgi:hypothetical protein
MKLALVASLAILGCGNDSQVGSDADQGADSSGTADAPLTTTDVTANITTDTTWSGLVHVKADIAVAAGVTLTVMPHTRIQVAAGDSINVLGTVNVNGVKGGEVYIESLVAADNWDAWLVSSGTLNMTYVIQSGGGITVSGTGKVMARDSHYWQVTHDLLVVSGGTVDMQYSWIGVADGQPNYTHCDMHFEGGSITMSHSNVSASLYGVMLYTGNTVDFTYDNWFSNSVDLDILPAPLPHADISNSWFKKGNPTNATLTKNNMATSMVADAGPR